MLLAVLLQGTVAASALLDTAVAARLGLNPRDVLKEAAAGGMEEDCTRSLAAAFDPMHTS